MPSAPGYKRDLKQERKTELARGGKEKNIERKQARRDAVKAGLVHVGDGKDVNHIKPLAKGGKSTAGSLKNLNIEPASVNRSFPRKPDGSIK
jgi:hypothetical protein